MGKWVCTGDTLLVNSCEASQSAYCRRCYTYFTLHILQIGRHDFAYQY